MENQMDIFRFKQFNVNQSGCAMKINTDGVLLGAMANAEAAQQILDIGTGTGVIALMLAQRFADANIHTVEIDEQSCQAAAANFQNSVFHGRLAAYPLSFELFFEKYPDRKYDLIISNPPFYINSLLSPAEDKTLAKHADSTFFERLINTSAQQLTANGLLWLILPIATAGLVKKLAHVNGLYLQRSIAVHSYHESEPHREILVFGLTGSEPEQNHFVIYKGLKQYSDEYRDLLKDFLTIF